MVKEIRKIKTPGGRLAIHRAKKKVPKSRCGICGRYLFVNNSKKTMTGKRPTRPYSGKVCHSCLRTAIQLEELSF